VIVAAPGGANSAPDLNSAETGLFAGSANAAAGQSSFQSLFDLLVADLSSDSSAVPASLTSAVNPPAPLPAAPGGAVEPPSTPGSAPTRKPSSSDGSDNSSNDAAVATTNPSLAANPLLLSLLSLPLTQAQVPAVGAGVSSAPIASTAALNTQTFPSQGTISNFATLPTHATGGSPLQSVNASGLKGMQPVFTLMIRAQPVEPGAMLAAETSDTPAEQDGTAQAPTPVLAPAAPANEPTPAVANSAAIANADSVSNSAALAPASQTDGDSASNSTASAQILHASSVGKIAPIAVPATSSTNKPSDDQSSPDRDFAAPVIESNNPSQGSVPETRADVQPARTITEHVNTEPVVTAHPNSPVTDIRLQVEGAGNQHVTVRLVQEADGLRVSVRSNDPVLTENLQERVPELTTRLEQHHYQAELVLPDRNAFSAHPSPANSGTNLQQESSNRQQGSGQGSSQQKQNQQQRRQAPNGTQTFSSLLT
jgi:hypothetical protein